MRSIVWNPPKAECNQGGAVYGIKTQGTYTFGDHIRLPAVTYTHGVITYQPCGLDRKSTCVCKCFFLGRVMGVEPTTFRATI